MAEDSARPSTPDDDEERKVRNLAEVMHEALRDRSPGRT